MEQEPYLYKTVHDYLDFLYKEIKPSPSLEEVLRSKKTYWRSKNSQAKRIFRKKYSEFSIFFSPEELKIIHSKMDNERYVSRFIRKQVLALVSNDETMQCIFDTAIIEQQLFVITDHLQDIVDSNVVVDEERINNLEDQITKLQNLIEQQVDTENKNIQE